MAAVTINSVTVTGDRSASWNLTGNPTDTVAFSALLASLSTAQQAGTLGSFLSATRGTVPLTIAALVTNGVMVQFTADQSAVTPYISADKTFKFDNAMVNACFRISLSYSASA